MGITAKSLIEKGYFPDKIIPPLTAADLANILDDLSWTKLIDITTKENKNRDKKDNKCPKSSKCCHHSAPRSQNLRRDFCIPNPFHQLKLIYNIEKYWDEINEFISDSPISLTIPIINDNSPRSFEHNADRTQKMEQLALRSTACRTMLKSDISRYFQTIYTHSIPWALHGKENAKNNREGSDDYCGNYLDQSVQHTMDGQTIGIPTGPDTSEIISEIIGKAIENKLIEDGIKLNGIRYVDDFALFFSSRHDAEVALHKLQRITIIPFFGIAKTDAEHSSAQFLYSDSFSLFFR